MLKINGTVNFMGIELPNIYGGFGEGKKAITDKHIAKIHGMTNRNVRARINEHINRFKEGIDCIDLKRVCDINTLISLGYAKQSITQAEHIYLLSERGYAKLIKIMDTDLAWEIHDKLIDEYFTMKQVIQQLSNEDIAWLKVRKGEATVDDVDLIVASQVKVYKGAIKELARGEEKVIKQSDVAEKLSVDLPSLKVFFVKMGWFEEKRFLRKNAKHEHDFEHKIHHQPTRLFIEEIANKGLAGTKPADERGKIIVEFFDKIIPYLVDNYSEELQSFMKAQRYEFFSN